ncbi:MAG: rhomboid family intramembrane serine protease [Acidimicrobiales bacterium]|nr:rhomboid family intramembrane serine protease [Acidimicrobiales bacterium]
MLPLRDDNPVRTTPVVTWAILAACLAVFLLWQPTPFSDTVDDVEFNLRHAAIPCEVVEGRPLTVDEVVLTFNAGQEDACGEGAAASPAFDGDKNVWLAVVVSMFLHGGVLHLAGNLLFLWVFGNNIEDRLGKVAFAAFYLAGGVAATAAHVAVGASSTVPVVGASGAIAAIMGAYLVLYPNARVRTAVFMILITVVDIRAKWVLGFWFVLQFFTDPNQGVAWVAHVGGFVFGAAVALVIRSVGPPPQALHPGGYRPGHWPPPPGGDDRGFGGRY